MSDWSMRWAALVLVGVVLAITGCSDDPDVERDTGSAADVSLDAGEVGIDVDEPGDVGRDVVELDASPDAGSTLSLCEPCTDDSQCGGNDDRCVEFFDGEMSCAMACDPEEDGACPVGYGCATLAESVHQCVPLGLTCLDRCSQVSCEANQVCDPLSGECMRGGRVCETGCVVDGHCAGEGSRCLGSGAPDGERFCTAACDPEAETRQCPADYFCIAINPDSDPNDGVCYPLAGTCTDRCSNVACAAGENCEAMTGACVQAQYGSCDPGCTSSAQCGGQRDVCLHLGIGDDAHCWLDCSADPCPESYNCASLLGTTLQVCIPLANNCTSCYGESCFPEGVCHSGTGECIANEADCTMDGCSGDDELCDPVSRRCVEVGRACQGGSWAVDCDNIVTKCTTTRPNTAGVCAKICNSNADCPDSESCRTTQLGRFCLEDDLGGPQTCGTLYETTTEVGRPCGAGASFCRAPATTCLQDAGIAGFCSMSCGSDADCGGDNRCAPGTDGLLRCLPPQCACAGYFGFDGPFLGALTTALSHIGFSQCDLNLDAAMVQAADELAGLPLVDAALADELRTPLATLGRWNARAQALDAAADTPAAALQAAARLQEIEIQGQAASYAFDGQHSKLTQAVAALISAGGGTPDLSALEAAGADVPDGFQDVAAPIIWAVADAVNARELALTAAGWDEAGRLDAFVGAPYLFLPGTEAEVALAPDLGDAAVRTMYESFPLTELTQASANLAATVWEATRDLGDAPAQWVGFSYVVETPVGKVILGDAGDTVYDPTVNAAYDGDIAVLIDAGGDDAYRIAAGANQSAANGVSLLVDLGGSDDYGYHQVADPLDTAALLPSDDDGRLASAGSLFQGNGPVSLSSQARQGAGRVGIGMLIDLGEEDDTFQSLRASQGAAVFGVGLLYSGGGVNTFAAEALSQGAAIGGLGVLWSAGGDDTFQIWHAGQGFGAGSGVGVLFNRAGADTYLAVPGQAGGLGVLYYSPTDRGSSNRNLAQGAGAGLLAGADQTGLGGGIGLLRDSGGHDTFTAATHAQGHGHAYGLGILAAGGGDDVFNGRGFVQGTGEWFAAGILINTAGADTYNQSTDIRQFGQGAGQLLGWGAFADLDGDNHLHYSTLGGGVGIDGGLGFAFVGGGADTHTATSTAWGYAQNDLEAPNPFAQALTIGVFLDAGGSTDTYNGADAVGAGNGGVWSQPEVVEPTNVRGVGVDQ